MNYKNSYKGYREAKKKPISFPIKAKYNSNNVKSKILKEKERNYKG